MGHDVVAFGHDQLVLITQCVRRCADKVEKPVTAWRDMGAVLDVEIRPEPFGGRVVALVEQRVEGFENEHLILFGSSFGHGSSRWLCYCFDAAVTKAAFIIR